MVFLVWGEVRHGAGCVRKKTAEEESVSIYIVMLFLVGKYLTIESGKNIQKTLHVQCKPQFDHNPLSFEF